MTRKRSRPASWGIARARATEMPPRRPPQVRILTTPGLKERKGLRRLMGRPTAVKRQARTRGMAISPAVR